MSTIKVTISNELMQNYKQAEIMSPEKKFEALQTKSGCSLLLSIGTDDVFFIFPLSLLQRESKNSNA